MQLRKNKTFIFDTWGSSVSGVRSAEVMLGRLVYAETRHVT